MTWARRPKSDEPIAEQRAINDDEGRHWIGSVTSGRLPGGEENAEIVWVCENQPSEPKRVSYLGVQPGRADELWVGLSDEEVSDVFRDSEIAD